jgi:hypothetical protein
MRKSSDDQLTLSRRAGVAPEKVGPAERPAVVRSVAGRQSCFSSNRRAAEAGRLALPEAVAAAVRSGVAS